MNSEPTLQDRIVGSGLILAYKSMKELLLAIRQQLLNAYAQNQSQTPPQEIFKFVKVVDDRIIGGDKGATRQIEHAQIVRDDGAWIHFYIQARPISGGLDLISYNFEIVFPPGHIPPFLRIDLNAPDHENTAREIRSHMHPGNDDLLIPSPIMTPHEILEILLNKLRARNPAHPRW